MLLPSKPRSPQNAKCPFATSTGISHRRWYHTDRLPQRKKVTQSKICIELVLSYPRKCAPTNQPTPGLKKTVRNSGRFRREDEFFFCFFLDEPVPRPRKHALENISGQNFEELHGINIESYLYFSI